MKVTNYAELIEALNLESSEIELLNSISILDSIVLKKGQRLVSKNNHVFLSFINSDGVALSGDNEISNISIQTSQNKRAIYINSNEKDLGEIKLSNLTITGVVQLMTMPGNKSLSLDIKNIDIVSADARMYPQRPLKYGVIVYQGALNIYNFNPEPDSVIRVSAENISIGRKNAPVIGSGIFISGFNDEKGKVIINKLIVDEVYSNGMIPNGQPNLITGGIFIIYGVYAKEIISNGTVETYGTNDMVLDVWGKVDSWIVNEDIVSYGTSGIGFVNFGEVNYFKSKKSIRTYGLGSRGFNQYDGTIKEAYFEKIETVGDGSIGMQFSKPVGKITIGKEISTHGSMGQTLVKGQIMELKADAISILDGGRIEKLEILGDVVTNGKDVVSYHVNGGIVENFKLEGNISAKGENSSEVLIENNGKSDISDIEKY